MLFTVLLTGVELRNERFKVCLGLGAFDLDLFSTVEALAALSLVGAFFVLFD